MNASFARSKAERIIEELGIQSPPVDIEHVARSLGLRIVYADLGQEVSGLLVSNGDSAYVCVRKQDHINRRRFTIAHEIGHFSLGHQAQNGEHVLVDKGYFISQRGVRASFGEDPNEIEANQFAACLLMPSKILRARVAALAGGPLLDYQVISLAKDFRVSEQSMTIRLTTLGLL